MKKWPVFARCDHLLRPTKNTGITAYHPRKFELLVKVVTKLVSPPSNQIFLDDVLEIFGKAK